VNRGVSHVGKASLQQWPRGEHYQKANCDETDVSNDPWQENLSSSEVSWANEALVFLRSRLYSQAIRKAKWEASSLRCARRGGGRILRGYAGHDP
jgi:hypothetical protein